MNLYLITNTVNGKQYVGKTAATPKERWRQHVRAAKNSTFALHRAIRKYGADNFTIQRLPIEPQSDDGLNEWEMFTIEALRRVGTLYNMTDGGEGASRGIKQHLADAQALAASHGGVLPNPIWLREHGFSGLEQYMRKCPEAFKHIEQRKKV